MTYDINQYTGLPDLAGSSSGGMTIGAAVSGGDPDRVLFIDASGNLGQDLDFFYDSAGKNFNVGLGTFAVSSYFAGSLTSFDGTDVLFESGVTAGRFVINPSYGSTASLQVLGSGVGDPPLLWHNPSGNTITFGDDLDLGGTIGFVAIGTGDDTIRVRELVGQTGRLTSWQAAGTNQVSGVRVDGSHDFGSTSQGVNILGATTGVLTLAGYGNSNNESLSLNFESVANTVGVTSSTGVTALTFSGFALSSSSYTGSVIMTDNVGLSMGSGTDARLEFDTSETNDTLKLGLVCNSANSSGNFIICESADINTDFGASQVINPTLRIQSSDATSTADFVAIYHDQTDGRIDVGAGNLKIGNTIDLSAVAAGTTNFIITATSDTPTVTWGLAAGNEASTAPAGYLEITVGGNARYIPFWA